MGATDAASRSTASAIQRCRKKARRHPGWRASFVPDGGHRSDERGNRARLSRIGRDSRVLIFVDANVPMYVVGGEHPYKARAQRMLERMVTDHERLVTSAEV